MSSPGQALSVVGLEKAYPGGKKSAAGDAVSVEDLQTVEAATLMPSAASSPWIRR
jgi:hypothetical protein